MEWFDDLTLGMHFKAAKFSVSKELHEAFCGQFDPQAVPLDEAARRKTSFKGLADPFATLKMRRGDALLTKTLPEGGGRMAMHGARLQPALRV